ncbi:MAG: homocitrate synthase [Hydrogenothermaceae bacterium]|nr:homocitrate synthase [Hydrogenothermaceae bacterium]
MKIFIDDTTLRDGEQTPGVIFTRGEKIRIAKLLDKIGIDEIEAGIPAAGKEEKENFKAIVDLGLNAKIIAWNRALISDVIESIDAGAKAVEISLPLSDIQIKSKLRKDRKWILEHIKKVLDFCKKNNLYVSVGGEDASRADIDFIIEYIKVIKEYGGDRFRYCDTVGIMDPFKMYETIKTLKDETGIEIEVHTHNDFGLATANAIAGIKAGASYVNTTVIGLGERAGNASLEEVIMILKHIMGEDVDYKVQYLRELSEFVAKSSGRQIEPYKPVIGTFMFTHESGIHVDGVIKDPLNYEAFSPEEIGMERKIVIGKHSGKSALVYVLKKYGMLIPENSIGSLLDLVKRKSYYLKRNLTDEEFIDLARKFSRKIGKNKI